MGKSSKKSVAKVVKKAEDVVMAEGPKPLKQGKREADNDLEKDVVRSKKQKVEEKKIEVKAQKKVVKKVVDTSEEESSESEDTKTKPVPAKKTTTAVAPKNGHMNHGKKDTSSYASEEETSSDDDAKTKKPEGKAIKKASGAAPVKENVSSSDESDSEDDSDEEVPAPVKTAAVPAKNLAHVESETESDDDSSSGEEDNGTVNRAVPPPAANPKKELSDDESESEEETSSDDDSPAPAKTNPATAAAKNGNTVAVKKKEESSSDESESDEETSSDDDSPATTKTAPAATAKNGNTVAAKKKEESSSDSDSSDEDPADHKKGPTSKRDESSKVVKPSSDDSDDDESEDEEPQKKKVKSDNAKEESISEESEEEEEAKNETKKGVPAKSSSEESSDEEEDEDDSSEEDAETPNASKKKNADVKMIDAVSTKPNVQKGTSAEKIEPKTPSTAKSEGTKTVFVGNLSYSIEQADIENFFKPAGEVVAVRLSTSQDGSFKGYGHVEFSSSEAAVKAVQQLNGKDLLGRPVKIDYARERGFNTPQSGGRDTPYQRGVRPSGQTVFVRGFDKNNDEHEIRSSLEEFFGGCGDVTRISIPKDQEGAYKGIAYIDFKDASALSQAVELNGSEFGNGTLTVEEARPRGDFSSGGGRDFQSGGRSTGGRNYGRGRDGGRFGDGRGRGRGRFNNDGRGRGRGSFNKPSFAASGKKTIFNDFE